VPDIWYLLDDRGRMGPFSHAELVDTLATYPNSQEVLVKRNEQVPWRRAGDFPELRIDRKALVNIRTPAFENIIPHRPIDGSLAEPEIGRQSAAKRWVKIGAVVGLIIGIINVLSQLSEGRLQNSNFAYLLAIIVFSACICGAIAFVVGAIADWMSRPKNVFKSSVGIPSTKPAARWNFIGAHWRGQLPLWVSYWVINFLVSIAVGVLAVVIDVIFQTKSGYDPILSFG
jgi:type III secretory pathway component EscS